MSKSQLLAYWPTPEAAAECLKVDAESSSEAVSLAVHQPMRFERRVIGGSVGQHDVCDEHELLRAFLASNLTEGRVILPIVGSSGIGKSHVVRWLETQMRGMPGADRRIVIRIPKGLGLKGVLRLLLNHLKEPAYDTFRQELVRAQEALDPDEAAGLLCEMLAHTLSTMYESALQTIRANSADTEARECEAICRPDMLPALLRNQLLRDQHFVRKGAGGDGIINRLVEHLTEDRTAREDDHKHFFVPDDLLFERVDKELLGRVEVQALHRFEAHEDRRKLAVRFLNTALEESKQRLVQLDPTVSELFEKIRSELFAEQKELVLLVEDFAVLSGLQKQLLQVMIKEGITDGRQVLCTMRTALAYTTGYLDTATVLRRAGLEYRIPDDAGSEAETFARIERQVGAYLNAARFGQAALERIYHGKKAGARDLRGWIPSFNAGPEPDARETLEAFGRSEDAYELFPFNRNAIRELARDGCLESGRVVYNPRLVIMNVLHRVLQSRDLYESSHFLSDGFGGQVRPLPRRVVDHVERKIPPGEMGRYIRFLAYWGGEPNAISDIASVDERVFAAFGLDRKRLLSGALTEQPASAMRPPTTSLAQAPAASPAPAVHPIEAKWEASLERWRGGESLLQGDANELRKWIAEALQGFIDWDWDLFKPLEEANLETWSRWIFIPRAGGGDGRTADESMVAVCTEAELESEVESARIQGALMAIVIFHGVHKCTWDFEGAEDCLPRYTAYMETLSEPARRFVRQRYFRHVWDPVPSLVQALLIGSRALGVEGSSRDTHHALIKSMFEPVPEAPLSVSVVGADTGTASWEAFTQSLRQCRAGIQRDGQSYLSWREHLLNLVGARQGGANAVHAVDVLRLKPAIEKAIETWTLDAVTGNSTGSSEFVGFRAMVQEIRKHSGAVESAQKKLVEWRARMSQWFGGELDKVALVNDLTGTLQAARDANMGTGLDITPCLKLIEEFRKAKVKEALDEAARLTPEVPRGTILAVLGSGYQSMIPMCEELMTRAETVLAAIEDRIHSDLAAHGDHPVDDALNALKHEIHETYMLLEKA